MTSLKIVQFTGPAGSLGYTEDIRDIGREGEHEHESRATANVPCSIDYNL